MGIVLVKIKLMPESPNEDLEEIKRNAGETVLEFGGKNPTCIEEPIAFGLKAVIISFQLDESLPLEPIEEELEELSGVSSIQVIDMRRAIG